MQRDTPQKDSSTTAELKSEAGKVRVNMARGHHQQQLLLLVMVTAAAAG
jgi:hypothetical protein